MKLEVGKTYVTIKGSKVRIICTDVKNNKFPVVGLMSAGNEEFVSLYTADGNYASSKKVVIKILLLNIASGMM